MWTNGQRMPTNGNLEPLRNFLVPRVCRLVLIDQPHPGSDRVTPKIEEYTNYNKNFVNHNPSWWIYLLTPLLKLTNQNKTQAIFKVRDFLSIIDWAFRDKAHYDYFVGMESVNTLAAIFLRKIGRVGKVIYYVLDYSPNRYSPALNKLYLALDRYCATRADFVWDVSMAMQSARISAGLDPKKSAPVIHVPIGVYPDQIKLATARDIQPYSLVYMGTLGEENGPDLAIEILPIIQKKYPTALLHIIGGGGENLDRLKTLAESLELKNQVIFHGFVVRSSNMANILSRCYVAVAPYRDFPNSVRRYADSSKMRSYAAAGLPIITTPVPPLGKDLQKLGGAIIAADNKKSFSRVVISLFSNPRRYAKMRRAIIKYAKNNTWDKEFSNAFSKSQ